jgi:hypothetical protein
MSQTTVTHTTAATVLGVIGIALYLGVGFIYLTSGLVVPFPWLLVLWVVWVVGVYPLVKTFQTRRAWTPVIPVAAVAFWWVYLSVGEALLGWTP